MQIDTSAAGINHSDAANSVQPFSLPKGWLKWQIGKSDQNYSQRVLTRSYYVFVADEQVPVYYNWEQKVFSFSPIFDLLSFIQIFVSSPHQKL